MSELSEIEVGEVSLVDKAANKRKFLIMKSQNGDITMGNELVLKCEEGMEDVLKAVAKVDQNHASILKAILADNTDVKTAIEKADDSIKPAMIMAVNALATVKKELGTAALEMIAKALDIELPKVEVAKEEETDETKAAIQKAAPSVVFKEDGSPDFDTVGAEIRPMLEMLWKQNETSAKQTQALELTLKSERDERLDKEFISKAAAFKHLTSDSAVLGPILKAASENLDENQFKELDRILKAADKGMASVFKEFGSEEEDEDDMDATKKLQKKAVDIAKRDGISKEKAFVKALDEYPDLAAQERAERTH